jgi:predicted patatin/cPLA2 family phospholipase
MDLAKTVERLKLKRQLLLAGDDRHKDIKTLLFIPGGGMRGAYAAGSGLALKVLGLIESFDNIVAVSAGLGIAYFSNTIDDAILAASVFTEECTTKEFIDLRRWRRVMDMDFFHDVIRHRKPLNEVAVRSHRSQFWIGVTDAATGQGELIDLKQAQPDMTTALIASAAMPGSFLEPIAVNGRVYVDGEIALPFPIELMVRKFQPTDILILGNHPKGISASEPLFSKGRIIDVVLPVLIWSIIRNRSLQKSALSRQRRMRESLRYFRQIRDINTGILFPPPSGINALTQDVNKLQAGMRGAFEKTLDVFGRNNVDEQQLEAVLSSRLFKDRIK